MKRIIQRSIFAIIIAGLTAGCASISVWDVLAGASKARRLQQAKNIEFSEADEYYLGRQILALLFSTYPPVFNRELGDYINSVGQTMAAASDRPEVWEGYRFIIVNSSEVAAFSLPGGFILISTAMLRLCENEDQLAAVLGHEIGHSVYRHSAQALKERMEKEAKQDLVLFLADRSGSNMARIGAVVAAIKWEEALNQYSREQELEADVYSIELMVRCGYDPMEMLKVLHRIPDYDHYYSRLHPRVKQRVDVVQAAIRSHQQIPKVQLARSSRYKEQALNRL